GEGRPIQARPLSWGGRFWRWCRRKPAAAALLGMALALVGLTLGSVLWLEGQRAERREEAARQQGRETKAVESMLDQMAALQKQGRWIEARTLLEATPSLPDASAWAELRARMQQVQADVNMVGKLEEIRLRLSETRRTHQTMAPEQVYAEAFQNYGISL